MNPDPKADETVKRLLDYPEPRIVNLLLINIDSCSLDR
jgi:hypothetical protein